MRLSSHLSRTAGQWNRRRRHICWVRCSAHRSGSRSHTQLQKKEGKTVIHRGLHIPHAATSFFYKHRSFIKLRMTSPSNHLHHQHINTSCIVYLDYKHVRISIDDISSEANNTNTSCLTLNFALTKKLTLMPAFHMLQVKARSDKLPRLTKKD